MKGTCRQAGKEDHMDRQDSGMRTTVIVLGLTMAAFAVAGLILGVLVFLRGRTVSGTISGTLPPAATQPAGPVWQVTVTKAGYEFNGKTYGRDDAVAVAADVKRAAGSQSEPVVILPAAEAEWTRVVEMFKQIQEVGFTKIGFAQELGDEPDAPQTQPEAPRS